MPSAHESTRIRKTTDERTHHRSEGELPFEAVIKKGEKICGQRKKRAVKLGKYKCVRRNQHV